MEAQLRELKDIHLQCWIDSECYNCASRQSVRSREQRKQFARLLSVASIMIFLTDILPGIVAALMFGAAVAIGSNLRGYKQLAVQYKSEARHLMLMRDSIEELANRVTAEEANSIIADYHSNKKVMSLSVDYAEVKRQVLESYKSRNTIVKCWC